MAPAFEGLQVDTETAQRVEEVKQYINKTGKELGGEYEDYEMIAIQILDSQFDEFPEGLLQRELESYLLDKSYELGAIR